MLHAMVSSDTSMAWLVRRSASIAPSAVAGPPQRLDRTFSRGWLSGDGLRDETVDVGFRLGGTSGDQEQGEQGGSHGASFPVWLRHPCRAFATSYPNWRSVNPL